MSLQFSTKKIITLQDFNELVRDVYHRPYNIQQQEGCIPRGTEVCISVPGSQSDYENTTVPEIVNHPERGVSFDAWLTRDTKLPLASTPSLSSLNLWWLRNFYPHVSMIVNDLHVKGYIEEGTYFIDIDW